MPLTHSDDAPKAARVTNGGPLPATAPLSKYGRSIKVYVTLLVR